MRLSPYFVNPLFYYVAFFQTTLTVLQLLDFVNQFCGEANYSKASLE